MKRTSFMSRNTIDNISSCGVDFPVALKKQKDKQVAETAGWCSANEPRLGAHSIVWLFKLIGV